MRLVGLQELTGHLLYFAGLCYFVLSFLFRELFKGIDFHIGGLACVGVTVA